MSSPAISRTVRIFYSYATTAPKDRSLFNRLKTFLKASFSQISVSVSDSMSAIKGNSERSAEFLIKDADIIVLLVSVDYLASECGSSKEEMQLALKRKDEEDIPLFLVLLHPVDLPGSLLEGRAFLPSDSKPVSQRASTRIEEALMQVAGQIREAAERIAEKFVGSTSIRSPSETQVSLKAIPYGHSRFFTDREDILTKIHTYFTSAQALQQTPILALRGMPGCGKTQIAVEYAHRHKDEYQAILWLDVENQQSLREAIDQRAKALSFLEEDRADDQHLFGAFQRWLQQHDRWLLILDNLDNLGSLQLMNLITPLQSSGHVLVTTLAQAISHSTYPVSVREMTTDESALFLLRRAGIIEGQTVLNAAPEAVHSDAVSIVQAVDGLPLALDQAGAYIEKTACSLARYCEIYSQRGATLKLLEERGQPDRVHPKSVKVTLSLTFEKVAEVCPEALELLRLFAFLHSDAIPRDMIERGASVLDGSLHTLATDPIALDKAIGLLHDFSLVQYRAETSMLSIHRVVQTILVEELMPKQRQRWASKAVRLMNRVFPEPAFRNWPICERYVSQARACAEHIIHYQLRQKEAIRLLQHLGSYCYQRDYYQEAERYLTAARDLHKQVGEADRIVTAVTLNSLALLYHRQGKYQEARALYQDALEIREQIYELDHESVAQTLNNLASLYADLGKYQEAETLYERALPIYDHTVGPDHPDRASALYNLAMVYEEQGKFSQAEPLYQQAFSIEERVLEADHPRLALNLVTRAAQCKEQGHYAEAEELYQQALAIQMRALGPDHLETARSLSGLADLYEAQQRYQEAEALYRQALAADEKALGREHSETATILYNLGYVCCQQRRYQEAEQLYQQSLAVYEKALGSEHPDLATVLHDLGSLYHLLGKDEQAEPFLRRGLAIREHALDPEHIDIAHSLGALVELLFQQHLDEQAEPLYQRFLNIIRGEYGPESSEVAEAQEEYALLLERINEQRKAGAPTDAALQQKMSESTPNDP